MKRLVMIGFVLGLVTTAWAWPPQPSNWKFVPTAVTYNNCGLTTLGGNPLMQTWGARIGVASTGGGDGVCNHFPPGNVLPCYPAFPIFRDFHGQSAWELHSQQNFLGDVLLIFYLGYHDRYVAANDWAQYWEIPNNGAPACRVDFDGVWVRP